MRKTIFFKNSGIGNITFKGSYDGTRTAFAGIATDEVYLIAAECQARLGQVAESMQLLNGLLTKRWKKGTFMPYSASDSGTALQIILQERRKELVFRNLRWGDLKRLNREAANAKAVVHTVNSQQYVLSPGAPASTLPLPNKVIQLGGMAQN